MQIFETRCIPSKARFGGGNPRPTWTLVVILITWAHIKSSSTKRTQRNAQGTSIKKQAFKSQMKSTRLCVNAQNGGSEKHSSSLVLESDLDLNNCHRVKSLGKTWMQSGPPPAVGQEQKEEKTETHVQAEAQKSSANTQNGGSSEAIHTYTLM